MTNDQRKATYGVLVGVIVILLLLWGRNRYVTINNPGDVKVGGITVSGPTIVDVDMGDSIFGRDPNPVTITLPRIDVPGINIPVFKAPGSPYDWMQTTDLSCDCSSSAYKGPKALVFPDAPTYTFPVFTPQVFTWHYDVLAGTDGNLYTIMKGSDGKLFRWKSNKQPFNQMVYKEGVGKDGYYWMIGDQLIFGTRRYQHDAQKDRYAPALVRSSATFYG